MLRLNHSLIEASGVKKVKLLKPDDCFLMYLKFIKRKRGRTGEDEILKQCIRG